MRRPLREKTCLPKTRPGPAHPYTDRMVSRMPLKLFSFALRRTSRLTVSYTMSAAFMSAWYCAGSSLSRNVRLLPTGGAFFCRGEGRPGGRGEDRESTHGVGIKQTQTKTFKHAQKKQAAMKRLEPTTHLLGSMQTQLFSRSTLPRGIRL